MDVELDCSKTAMQNLDLLYTRLKALKRKARTIEDEMGKTERMLAQAPRPSKDAPDPSTPPSAARSRRPDASKKRKPRWSDAFYSFTTSGGHLAVCGKNARDNDLLYSKHFEAGDLFYHADIFGAGVLILQGGERASEQDKREAAQWSACFSSAFKSAAAAVDVYAVRKGQVLKHATGGHVGRGAFVIEGERLWFRETPLALKIFVRDGRPVALPALHPLAPAGAHLLTPGRTPKEEAAKLLSAKLSCKMADVIGVIPAGSYAL